MQARCSPFSTRTVVEPLTSMSNNDDEEDDWYLAWWKLQYLIMMMNDITPDNNSDHNILGLFYQKNTPKRGQNLFSVDMEERGEWGNRRHPNQDLN